MKPNRQEFKAKAKRTIDNLFVQVDQLEEKIQDATGETKTNIENKLDDLRQQKRELRHKFQRLEQSSEENWENVKNAFSNGVQAFKNILGR